MLRAKLGQETGRARRLVITVDGPAVDGTAVDGPAVDGPAGAAKFVLLWECSKGDRGPSMNWSGRKTGKKQYIKNWQKMWKQRTEREEDYIVTDCGKMVWGGRNRLQLRAESNSGILWVCCWTFTTSKKEGISWLVKQLSAVYQHAFQIKFTEPSKYVSFYVPNSIW
jgi:hypothetical protein